MSEQDHPPVPTRRSRSTATQRSFVRGEEQTWRGRFHDRFMRDLHLVKYDGGVGGRDHNATTATSATSATATSATSTTTGPLPPPPPPPSLVLSFVVTRELCNDFDTLHGGAQATAVDLFTSILLHELHPVPSVTTDLHVSCVGPAPLGSKVVAVCRAEKHGGKVQYSSCDLYREVRDGESTKRILVTKGSHTKYVVPNRTRGYGEAVAAGGGRIEALDRQARDPPRSKL